MSAKRLDEDLWAKIKRKYLESSQYGGKGWNARKAQLAVKEYKKKGGRYSKAVSRKNTSLHKWTDEKWGYTGKEGESRYLPEKVRSKLTRGEKAAENRRKSTKKGERVPYTASVTKKMRQAGVLKRRSGKI